MARAGTESGGGNPRDAFRAAFGAAKASHSRLDSDAADSHDDEIDLAGGEDDDEPDDAGGADEDADDDAEGDEGADDEAEGDDESEGEGDDADDDDDEEAGEAEGDDDDEGDDDKPELLTAAEIKQIQRKFPNDPGKQIKAFQAAFTRKTQDLATSKKRYSAYEQYYDLIDAMDERPAAILKRLGSLYGLDVNIGKGKGAAADDDAAGETETETAAELTGKAKDKALEEMRELLGPELEYQAEALLNVFEKFQGKRTKALLDRELKPLKQQNDQTIDQLADDKTNRLMKRMGKAHADWDEHEDEMLALSKKLSPNGMSMEEYLEHLYQTVTRGKRDDRARKLKKKLKRQERVNPAEARGRRSATPDTQVRRRARRDTTWNDAYQAAKRGERWDAEDDD